MALEDLVEEIFGEIEDEHDTTSYIAKSVGDNEYILSGRLEIEKVNELFSLDLPEMMITKLSVDSSCTNTKASPNT